MTYLHRRSCHVGTIFLLLIAAAPVRSQVDPISTVIAEPFFASLACLHDSLPDVRFVT
jgi:hypothetical protein